MSDVEQCHISELRGVLADCLDTLRSVQPHIAMQPVRLAVEAVAKRAEQSLASREVTG